MELGVLLVAVVLLPTPSASEIPFFVAGSGEKCPQIPLVGADRALCQLGSTRPVLDMAFLAQLAYITHTPTLLDALIKWFPLDCKPLESTLVTKLESHLSKLNSQLEGKSSLRLSYVPTFIYNQTSQPPMSIMWYEFYDMCSSTWLVTVRGSKISHDWINDANLWIESAFQCLVPYPLGSILTFFPDSVRPFTKYRNVYEPLTQFIAQRLKVVNKSEILVLGHSLGGGLAKISAAQNGIQSIGFSAPGILGLTHKLNLTYDQILQSTFDVIPHRDLVPKIDYQGWSFFFPCTTDVVSCHFIQNTIQYFQHACGDPKQRCFLVNNNTLTNLNNNSTTSVGHEPTTPQTQPIFSQVRLPFSPNLVHSPSSSEATP